MRWLGWIVTLIALVFAGHSGHALWLNSQAAPEPVVLVQPDGRQPSLAPQQTEESPLIWPPIFGTPAPPEPEPLPVRQEPEPEPQREPKPPIDTLGYALKGLVQTGNATWAMVQHPSGEQLVKPGDTLGEAMVVTRIDEQGVWVSRDGDAPELLGFAQ